MCAGRYGSFGDDVSEGVPGLETDSEGTTEVGGSDGSDGSDEATDPVGRPGTTVGRPVTAVGSPGTFGTPGT